MNFKSLFVAASVAGFVALSCATAQAQSPAPLQGQVLPGAHDRGGSDDNPSGVAKDLPSDAKLLRDHLAEGGPSGSPSEGRGQSQAAAKAPSATASGPAGAASAGSRATDDLGIGDAIKGVVKPLHQEVANSALVKAVREIDASITGKGDADGANGPGGAGSLDGQGVKSRPTDALAAKLILEQFLDEILPWLAGLAVLLGLGYAMAFWFKYVMAKKARELKQMRHVSKSKSKSTRRRSSSSSNR